MIEKINAWWFAAGDRLPHGDNRSIVVGETHSISGPIVLCQNALHASRDPYDALQYAPGPYLYRVRVWGDVEDNIDKIGGRHREYLAMRDATDMLCRYARNRVLSVAHLRDMPKAVRQYLDTGDETLREAATAARSAAAWVAVDAAAWSAERGPPGQVHLRAQAAEAENRRVFGEMVTALFAELAP